MRGNLIRIESRVARRRIFSQLEHEPERVDGGRRWHEARLIGLQGRYAEAEELCRDVLAARRRVLGDDHPDTLTSRDTLAWLAGLQGRRAEAVELHRQVLADRSRVLGAHHPDTQATRDELAELTADS